MNELAHEITGVNPGEIMAAIDAATELTDLTQLDRVEAKLDKIITFVERLDVLLDDIAPHVDTIGPMIEQLQNHPMLKMFLGKKGK